MSVGFLQALGLTLYCGTLAFIIFHLPKDIPDPGFMGFFVGLLVLVSSAAITGSLVFGYPTYLAVVRNKIKEASTVLAFTLLYFSAIILITIILIISVFG